MDQAASVGEVVRAAPERTAGIIAAGRRQSVRGLRLPRPDAPLLEKAGSHRRSVPGGVDAEIAHRLEPAHRRQGPDAASADPTERFGTRRSGDPDGGAVEYVADRCVRRASGD
ncbi:hypothetical protein [Actinomadura hibisca]|uniref:hypothetical protein n=1 Tax=Actinomadura hibisca TaxID=68565 RepID=UPI0008376CCC|nr:hypothetical protein [Actinomadura hibisca]